MTRRTRRTVCGSVAFIAAVFGAVFAADPPTAKDTPKPVLVPGAEAEGSASVAPATGVAGEFGTWTVSYRVGKSGLGEGSGIRVELPDAWHAGARNSAQRLQATDPKDEAYVTAFPSRAGVTLQTFVEGETADRLVKSNKQAIDNRGGRYVFVVRVRVTAGRLEEDDKINVVYGDRKGGSPGMRAGVIDMKPEPVLVAVDSAGANQFKLLAKGPRLEARPGALRELLFHAPSQARVGDPIELLVSMVDAEANPASMPTRPVTILLFPVSGSADFPKFVKIPAKAAFARFTVTPRAEGVVRIRADESSKELGFTATCNPIDVTAALPARQLYWGDLHSHTHYSWDGVGDQSFDYARHTSGLDFYARTDHAMAPKGDVLSGLSEKAWAEYCAQADKYNDPGKFVTLHAYECSFGRPYGHHNIYFRDRPGPLVYPSETALEAMWKMMTAGDVLTIPHHTGKMPAGIDFSHHDPVFRRNIEIYSGHGLSEAYDPGHPLSFEHSNFTAPAKSLQTPSFAQDAWKAGLTLSTIASSDDHRAHPGQPHYGIAAVRAPGLTRNDIFQSLHDGHTYGTTGVRIILEFHVNETPMGQTAAVSAPPTVRIRALGTDVISSVELLRWQPAQDKFTVIKTWQPDALDFADTYRDAEFQPGAVYYMRMTQKNLVHGLTAMAWSSPVWTK